MDPVPRFIARYEILQRLGEGGMGALYLARDPHIDRFVALKLLHGHLGHGELRERFVREARSAGSLAHPNIVTIYDFGEFGNAPFIVMEYVRGETLAEIIRRKADVALVRKLRWLESMCGGLAHAHAARIVHRDIKPQNLMVDERDTLKILDFGIARFAESGLTKASVQIGTPGYMSPEQIEGGAIDHRSDIFSAGAVAYEVLGYKEAFSGDTVATILNRVLNETPGPLSRLCPGLDPAVENIVSRALNKDPGARFQHMEQMRHQLERARTRLEASDDETRDLTPSPKHPDTPTPRRRADPAAFARKRAEQIAQHLADARRHFESGHDAEAEAACEAALVLDPEYEPALQLLDSLHARAEVAAEILPLLKVVEEALTDGRLTTAQELIDQAIESGASAEQVGALREQLRAARAEREQARRRAQAVKSAIDKARASAASGAREAALRYLGEALALEPENADALELKRLWARPAPPPREAPAKPSPPPIVPAPPGPNPAPWLQRPMVRPALIGGSVLVVVALAYVGFSGRDATPAPSSTSAVIRTPPPPPKPEAPPSTPGGTGDSPPPSTAGTPAASSGGGDVLPTTGPASKGPSPAEGTKATPAGTAPSSEVGRLVEQGRTLESGGRLTDAVQRYEAALKLDPKHSGALEGRDRVRLALADRELRIRDALRRADQLYQIPDYDAAIAEVQKALALDRTHRAARELLQTLENAKAAEAALLKKKRQGR